MASIFETGEATPPATQELGSNLKQTINSAAGDVNSETTVNGDGERDGANKTAAQVPSDDNSSEDEAFLKFFAKIKSKAKKKEKKKATPDPVKPNEVEPDSDSNVDESMSRGKVGKAPRLIRGFTDYIHTLEDRIGKLEAAVIEKADEQDEKRDADTPSQDTNVQTVFYNCANEPKIDFIDMIENERWKEKGSFTSEVDQNHFLRVLYRWESGPTDLSDGAKPKPNNIDILAIRLYSKPVAAFLQKLARYQVHKDNLILMTKSFRLLIQNASTIQDHLRKLQEKYSVSTEIVPAANSADSQEGVRAHQVDEGKISEAPQDAESPEAVSHFQELVDFIDTYLGDQVQLYQALRAGKQTKVAFQNAWMLYEPHETIYSPSQKDSFVFNYFDGPGQSAFYSDQRDIPQAYRVLATAGGTLRFGSLLPTKGKDSDDGSMSTILRYLKGNDGEGTVQRAKDKYAPLYIYVYFLDYLGGRFKVTTEAKIIRPFDGEAEISSLEVYPMKFRPLELSEDKAQDLADRGLKFIDYTAVTHLNYKGETLGSSKEEIIGPVIVDREQAFADNPGQFPPPPHPNFFWLRQGDLTHMQNPMHMCSDAKCHNIDHLSDMWSRYQREACAEVIKELSAIVEDYAMEDGIPERIAEVKKDMAHHALLELLPGHVHGYALRDRKWFTLDINHLEAVEEDTTESGWNDLILPSNHRVMVQSMVETHSAGGSKPTKNKTAAKTEIGLVQGKGKGCIILLHGVPGVGKTSTAECVAAYTKRPLFPITCGDIGYEPVEVEKNLGNLFKLAHRWGCVLLIDEADVFLAERDKADVKRNGLVSVFLRILEYYSGILFLTTNRVGAFDDAFRSRIHLTLYYPKLDEEQSYKVWETNIKRVARMNKERVHDGLPKIKMQKDRILRFAELNYETLQWNGRQIQNAFQTAIALAQFKIRKMPEKRPEITVEHFETIAKASIQFDSYLKEVHLGDEAKNAKKKGVRADNLRFESVRKVQLPPGTKSKIKRVVVEEESSSESETEENETEESKDSSEEERRKRKKKKAKTIKVKETSKAETVDETKDRRKKKEKIEMEEDGSGDEEKEKVKTESSKKTKGKKKKVKEVKSSEESDSGNGQVRIPLLDTSSEEPWKAVTATVLKLLATIHQDILAKEPYYNEPGRNKELEKDDHNSTNFDAYIQRTTFRHAILPWLDEPSIWKDIVQEHFIRNEQRIRENAGRMVFMPKEWVPPQAQIIEAIRALNNALDKFCTPIEDPDIARSALQFGALIMGEKTMADDDAASVSAVTRDMEDVKMGGEDVQDWPA